jgi:hypothetical protein
MNEWITPEYRLGAALFFRKILKLTHYPLARDLVFLYAQTQSLRSRRSESAVTHRLRPPD